MTYHDHLIHQARKHWSLGDPLPLHLFSALLAEGLDVVDLEQQYLDVEIERNG